MHLNRACVVVLLGLVAFPLEAGAQGMARSFDQLQLLVREGNTVTVVDARGAETTGRIDALSPSSLTLVTSGTRQEFRETEVASILHRRGDSLGNGALWGLASGAAFALIAVAAGCHDCEPAVWVALPAVYGGLGAAIGVGVDALITRRQVIYQRPAGAAAFGVAPLLGNGRRGAALSVVF